jgi:hypothetical protein
MNPTAGLRALRGTTYPSTPVVGELAVRPPRTGGGTLDELGEVRLGVVDVYGVHVPRIAILTKLVR